jgi:hypothetical protein
MFTLFRHHFGLHSATDNVFKWSMNVFLHPFSGVTNGKSSHRYPVYHGAAAVDEAGGQALRNDKVKLR